MALPLEKQWVSGFKVSWVGGQSQRSTYRTTQRFLYPMYLSSYYLTNWKEISLRLRDRFTIAPSQTRVIPIVIEQTAPFKDDSIQLRLLLISGQISRKLSAVIPVVHKKWGPSERQALKGTFFFSTSNPSAFIALPPMLEPPRQQLPILALRSYYISCNIII